MPNAIMNATTIETTIAPQATTLLNNSLRSRPPINQLIKAPASGAKIIRLKRLFSVILKS